MAYFVETSVNDGANSFFADYTLTYPPQAKSGDLLILRVHSNGNTTEDFNTPTGWTKVGTTQNVSGLGALYYRLHDGVDSSVTVTATAGTFRWCLQIDAFRDVDQTTPVVTSAEGTESGTKITFPSVTPTSKSDLYYVSTFSNSSQWEMKSDCSGNYPFELIGLGFHRWTRGIIISWITGIDSTVATGTDVQLQSNNTNKGGTVLIIKNSAGGRTTAPVIVDYAENRKFGDFCNDNANEVDNDWVDGSTIVGTIDGDTVVTEANKSNGGSGNTGNINGTNFSPTSTIAGEWSWWYQSITVDFTGKTLIAMFGEPNANRAEEVGIILLDSLDNYSIFSLPQGTRFQNQPLMVSLNSTPRFSSITPADLTDITKVGTISRHGGNSTDGHYLPSIKIINKIQILGGTSTDPSTSQSLYHLQNALLMPEMVLAQGEGQLLSRTNIEVGDGTSETVFSGNDKSLEFGGDDGVQFLQDSQDLSLTFNSSSTDDVSVNSINASSNSSAYDLTNANASATYSFDGTTVAGMKPTLNASIAVNAQKFSNCDTIIGAGGTYTSLIVESSVGATNAMQISAGADLTGSTFEKGAETYALELTNAGSYDLSNCTFTGYTTDLNVTATTGTVSVTLALGQSTPTHITAGATVSFILPQLSGTVASIVAGSRLQVYNVTTATEIYNDIPGTSYTINYDEGAEFTSGDTVRVRLTCQSGITACDWFEVNTVANASGWSVLAAQLTLPAYTTIGIDGSTVGEYTLDGANVQVDANDLDGTTTKQRLVAWYYYAGTTEEGIRSFFKGIMLEDEGNARIETSVIDLLVDNVSNVQLQFTDNNFRLYRDDDASWVLYPSTGGQGVSYSSDKVYVKIVGGQSGDSSGYVPGSELNIQTTPGITVTASVFTKFGVQVNGTVTLTEVSSGQYTGSFPLNSVADGQYIVKFSDGTNNIGVGDMFVRNEEEITQELFETKVEADARQTDLITEHDDTQAQLTALSSSVSDVETKAEADIRQAALIAEHDATQVDTAAIKERTDRLPDNPASREEVMAPKIHL